MRGCNTGRWTGWSAAAVAATVVLACVATAAPAPPAPPATPARETVNITILGIRATTEPKEHIDPALRPIADELKRSQYNCFRLAASDTRSIAVGSSTELPLIEDYAIRIQPEKVDNDRATVTLIWMQYLRGPGGRQGTSLQKMTMTLPKGKYLMSGGWKLKEGALLAAISVQ